MKRILGLLIFAVSLWAQIEPGKIYEVDIATGQLNRYFFAYEFTYRVKRINGVKTLQWYVEVCRYGLSFRSDCTPISADFAATTYSEVGAVLTAFHSQYPDGVDRFVKVQDAAPRVPARDALTTRSPAPPPNPRMIFLDGLGNSLLSVDMNNFNTVASVVVPSTSGPLSVRPVATGEAHEVWVANGGLQVSVADLTTQTLITNIPTPGFPPGAASMGIVFTNGGSTAFELIKYISADSNGNKGALLLFDAQNRTLTSTIYLKDYPNALVMAPDGLVLYILYSSGNLTYYDVLSGTADLTVSTYTPGSPLPGYPGFPSPVFIHPDGTRLFWEVGGLVTFDLNQHKVTNYFKSNLPTTSSSTFTLSQDGARAYISNGAGDVVIMDTAFGNILIQQKFDDPMTVYGGLPQAP